MKNNRSVVQSVQIYNLRGVLYVRRIDEMRNESINEMCGVNVSTLRCSDCVEMIDGSRLNKRIYIVMAMLETDQLGDRRKVESVGKKVSEGKKCEYGRDEMKGA